MKRILPLCVSALAIASSSYAQETLTSKRFAVRRIVRFLNKEDGHFVSFINRCDNQGKLTLQDKQKLLDIQKMIVTLKEEKQSELNQLEHGTDLEDEFEDMTEDLELPIENTDQKFEQEMVNSPFPEKLPEKIVENDNE